MRCPACGSFEDRVVDSRQAEDGLSIRRRRECDGCGRRFTTFERLEEASLLVTKRNGLREPFDRDKVTAGVTAAAKARPVTAEAIDELVELVEDCVRRADGEVTTELLGQEVLARLRALDRVAAVRFASVHKGFDDVDDFAREISLLTEGPPSPAADTPTAQ